MEMNFRSDNESPAAPAIMTALQQANEGTAWAYAEDYWSERLEFQRYHTTTYAETH